MRFLIIEDSTTDTAILTRYIQKSYPNAAIHSCKNFSSGVTSLLYDNYDCIFLDLNLPDNWGISTVKDIHPYCKGTPIMVITGMAHEITRQEAVKAGATSVQQKRDVTSETISDIVQNMALVG